MYARERNSASEVRTGRRQLDRRRLDRAAVLVEEADDRGERGREREQQADLDGEAHRGHGELRA